MNIPINDLRNNLIQAHHNIRANPKSIIPLLQSRHPYYKDKLYFLKDQPKKAIRTKDGYEAVKELIDYLKRLEPFDNMIYSQELEKAAQDHANYLSTNKQQNTDSKLQARVQKYTDWEGHLFQNVEYGFLQPSQLLHNLLIDDGLKNRPNRLNILNHEIKYMGVGVAPHDQFNIVAVFVYATGLRSKIHDTTRQKRGSYNYSFQSKNSYDNDNKNDIKSRGFEVIAEASSVPTRSLCATDKCLLF